MDWRLVGLAIAFTAASAMGFTFNSPVVGVLAGLCAFAAAADAVSL